MSDETQQKAPSPPQDGPAPSDTKLKYLKLGATEGQYKTIHEFMEFRVKGGHSPDYAQALVDIIEHVQNPALFKKDFIAKA